MQRNHVRVPALRRLPFPGPRDEEKPALEVDIGLQERPKLALPEPGIDGRREERAKARRQRREKQWHLVHSEVVANRSLRHAALLDLRRGVRPAEQALPPSPVERGRNEPPEVVDALGRQTLSL